MGSVATADLDPTLASGTRGPRLTARLRERISSRSLDNELAGGADPASSEVLEARARRLTSRRHRTRIAAGLDETVRAAFAPPAISARVPFRRDLVRHARPEIEALAAELRERDACEPRGVAMARLLLVDGMSPLYVGGGDQLLDAVRSAFQALRLRGER